jgi:hypothetical protein
MSISKKKEGRRKCKKERKALTSVAWAAKWTCPMYIEFLNNRYVQKPEDT